MNATFGISWMLITDVDDTLTGDDAALQRLVEALATAGSVRLVLDSSRPIQSVAGTLSLLPVPVAPDAVVGALGTEIEIAGIPQSQWHQRFAGWDRGPVDEVMADLGWPAHSGDLQTPYKASFAVPEEGRLEAERRIADAGVNARFLHGNHDDFDVIPSNAGKEAPLSYLAGRLHVDLANTVAAGDGANDISLLRATPHAVMVGNADDRLRAGLAGTDAYQAEAPYAGGILEGLRALQVLAGAGP